MTDSTTDTKHFTVTRLEPDDLPAAHGLSQALNWPFRLVDWEFGYRLGEGVAVRDGDRLVGVGVRWDFGPDFATVGMIIVDNAYQGQRLGSRVVDALLDGAGGRSVLLNATPEGLGLYRRRGFVETGTVAQHQGILTSFAATDPGPGLRVEPGRAEDLAAITILDEAAAGMPRHDLIAALAPESTICVLRGDDGGVAGYAFCREFGRGHIVGPVIARETAEAMALIAQVTQGLEGRFVRINTPEDRDLGDWLAAHGMVRVDADRSMVRGTLPAASPLGRIFTFSSSSLG